MLADIDTDLSKAALMVDQSPRCTHPTNHRLTRLALVLVALCQCWIIPEVGAADIPAFLADYHAAIKRQADLRKSSVVEGVLVEERTRDKKIGPYQRLVQQFVHTRNPTHEKIEFHFTEGLKPSDPQNEVRVIVQGAERNFWLLKPSPSDDFAITMIETPTATSKDALSRQRTFLVNAWSNLASTPIAKRFDSPGFQVERVEPDGDLIRVEFSVHPQEPKKPSLAGHFVVDPTQGMAIRRQNVRIWSAANPDRIGTIRGEATYRMVDGIALPDEVDFRIGSPANPDQDHMHFRATSVSTASVPDSAFTLSAFGLGDLDQPTPRSRFDFAYWAIGLAGVAFALSLFLRWRGPNRARAGGQTAGLAG